MSSFNSTIALNLRKIPGFESTDYGYLNGNIVWTGSNNTIRHPRNFLFPWQPSNNIFDPEKLHHGALLCKKLFEQNQLLCTRAKGLLLWLLNEEMLFPLNLSVKRFDAIKQAIANEDSIAFSSAAINVLGLGNGLTPSGDDFVGGIVFALTHAHLDAWQYELPKIVIAVHDVAQSRTNVISAALLDDLMAGKSYGALHDVIEALETLNITHIEKACDKLLNLGASSGADMLAGLLLALTLKTSSKIH